MTLYVGRKAQGQNDIQRILWSISMKMTLLSLRISPEGKQLPLRQRIPRPVKPPTLHQTFVMITKTELAMQPA